MVEEWRPVVGWEKFYAVSDLGRVRSTPREFVRGHDLAVCRVGGTIYRTRLENGWPTVTLGSKNGMAGRSTRVRVAYLVAESFTDWDLSGCVIDFRNGNSSDVRLKNLVSRPLSISNEIWRPCPGFEQQYEVSDLGRVRSVARDVGYRNSAGTFARRVRPRVLRPGRNPKGYLCVNLRTGGSQRHLSVHSLVCAAFHGARPAGMDVRHLDGDRVNNRADNLAYGTRSENEQDKYIHAFARMAGISVSEAMRLARRD